MKNLFSLKYLLIVFVLFTCTPIHAQKVESDISLESGILRIKFKETKAKFIQKAKLSKSVNGYVKIGDKALDAAMEKSKAYDIKRVFRDAGKFEAKHQKYGLHL